MPRIIETRIIYATDKCVISSLICCVVLFTGSCSCRDYKLGGYGNCQKSFTHGSNSGPICFVEEPSTCNDAIQHPLIEHKVSWEACTIKITNEGQ